MTTQTSEPLLLLNGHWFALAGILEPLALAPEVDSAALVGFPVAKYPSHANGSIIFVTGDRTAAVAAIGWKLDHEVYRKNPYNNPFINVTFFCKTLGGNSSRIMIHHHLGADGDIGERATPMTANSRDNNWFFARLYRAGISLRRVRSPLAPKITMAQGSPGLPIRCCSIAGITSVWTMGVEAVLFSLGLYAPVIYAFCFAAAAGSTWPPNFWRMAESIFSAKVCSCRERKRVYSAAERTSTGTASSIAAWMVQRPSPES